MELSNGEGGRPDCPNGKATGQPITFADGADRENAGQNSAGLAKRLPAGSTGTAAIFTDRVKLSHFIRKILLRQIAIMNYVNPFWEISDGAYIALFATMSEAIMDNKETVDKFIGDVVMAIWNAPGDAPDHVTNACRAALACPRIIAN